MTPRTARMLCAIALIGVSALGCAFPRGGGQILDKDKLDVEMPADEGAGKSPKSSSSQKPPGDVIRGQSPGPGYGQAYAPPVNSPYGQRPSNDSGGDYAPGNSNLTRGPMPVSGAPFGPGTQGVGSRFPAVNANGGAPPVFNPASAPIGAPLGASAPPAGGGVISNFQPGGALPAPPPDVNAQGGLAQPGVGGPLIGSGLPGGLGAQPVSAQPGLGAPGTPYNPYFNDPNGIPQTYQEALSRPSDLDVFVQEARTGKFQFGAAVNSNTGLTGQITVEERNFNIFRVPRSWEDLTSGGAFRGGGQFLQIQAYPGTIFQSYSASLTEPYLFGSDISGTVSGYYFNRNYFDYFETRVGGTVGGGYRLTPDISVQGTMRMEDVTISNPRVLGVPQLDQVLGRNALYGSKISVMRDTRDIPFAPTEGNLVRASFEQVFGTYVFPKFDLTYYQYLTLRQRPDGSGRHVLGLATQLGFEGANAPMFEHYFAGGYTTLRGFYFRGASPVVNTVKVGGTFQFINSVEYQFPLTADDMIKSVVFCDFGAVEPTASFSQKFRVSPGFGFRINIPAMGPAPLAFDFAFPVVKESFDQRQTFSFFMGVSRQ